MCNFLRVPNDDPVSRTILHNLYGFFLFCFTLELLVRSFLRSSSFPRRVLLHQGIKKLMMPTAAEMFSTGDVGHAPLWYFCESTRISRPISSRSTWEQLFNVCCKKRGLLIHRWNTWFACEHTPRRAWHLRHRCRVSSWLFFAIDWVLSRITHSTRACLANSFLPRCCKIALQNLSGDVSVHSL